MKQIFTLTFIFAWSLASFADGTDQIKELCKDEWTKAGALDQEMFNHCIKKQSEGVAEIKSIESELKGKMWFENFSGPNCFKSWTKRDIVNYEMVAHCMKSEKEGYLGTKFQYDKKSKEIAIDCIITHLASSSPMEMSDYCIRNYSPLEKSKADSAMNEYSQSHPEVKGAKGAREMVENAIFGKQEKPIDSTLPPLPDVANLPNESSSNSPRVIADSNESSGGMMAKLKNLIPSWGISDEELTGLENSIKHSVSGSGAFKFEAQKVSDGTVANKLLKLVKVKYTDATPHPRQCAYVLYHYDKDAGVLTDIQVSSPNMMDGSCSVNSGCFGCGQKSFMQRLKEKGYSGKIEDI